MITYLFTHIVISTSVSWGFKANLPKYEKLTYI